LELTEVVGKKKTSSPEVIYYQNRYREPYPVLIIPETTEIAKAEYGKMHVPT
jgi:hypothetical protein